LTCKLAALLTNWYEYIHENKVCHPMHIEIR